MAVPADAADAAVAAVAAVPALDLPNIQRQVALTCTIRIMREDAIGNLANANLNQVNINIHNLESDLQESFGNFITETLTAEHNFDLDGAFIMRPHSDINVGIRRREHPDVNVFEVQANFTIKYNNLAFWDYSDRYEDAEVGALRDAFLDYSDIRQNINGVEFFRMIQDLDIRMGGEEPFVPLVVPQMGGGRRSRRRRSSRRYRRRGSSRSHSRRSSRSSRSSRRHRHSRRRRSTRSSR